jgi:hypothetical protein
MEFDGELVAGQRTILEVAFIGRSLLFKQGPKVRPINVGHKTGIAAEIATGR